MPRNYTPSSVVPAHSLSGTSSLSAALIDWKTYTREAISAGGLDREASRDQDPDLTYQVDPTLTPLNRFISPDGALLESSPYTDTLYEREMGRIRTLLPGEEIPSTRVIDIGLVLKASSGILASFPSEKLEEWARESWRFVCDVFGKDNVHLAVLHMDETSPHIHVHVTPLRSRTVLDGDTSRTLTLLDAQHYMAIYERRRIYELYVERMTPFGLGRGRGGSRLHYRDVHSIYDEANMAADHALSIRRTLEAYNEFACEQLLQKREELSRTLGQLSEVEDALSSSLDISVEKSLSLRLKELDFRNPASLVGELSSFGDKATAVREELKAFQRDLEGASMLSLNPVARQREIAKRAAAIQRKVDHLSTDAVLEKYALRHHTESKDVDRLGQELENTRTRMDSMREDLTTTALCLNMLFLENRATTDPDSVRYIKEEILASSLDERFIQENLSVLFHDEISLRGQIPWLGKFPLSRIYEVSVMNDPGTDSLDSRGDTLAVEFLGNIPVNRGYLTGGDDPDRFHTKILWESLQKEEKELILREAHDIFTSRFSPLVAEELSGMYSDGGAVDVLAALNSVKCRSESWDRRRVVRGKIEDIRLSEFEAERERLGSMPKKGGGLSPH